MKRILSMLLVVCMVLTPLPSSAAGNTVEVSDAASLKSALTSSASGTIVRLASDISFADTITVPSSLTLDLNGRTLTFTGTDSEKKLLMVGILFTGSGTFVVKDSGTEGKLTTSQTYSVALRNSGSGIMELADGTITTEAETASAIINTGSGTLKLSGAMVESKKYFAVINQLTSGKLNMSSGTVSSNSGYGIENRGIAEISGGTVSSITSIGISNAGSGSLLTVSGGTVKSISGYAVANSGNGNTVKVTGGMVSSDASAAIANFNSCEISGGTVYTDTGMAVANVGGNFLISNGATVNSNSGTTVYTNDNLTIAGGTVNSVSGVVLFSDAPAGKMVTVSGGTLSSTSGFCAVNNAGGSMTISGTPVLSTISGSVSLINQGTGTAIINGATMTAATAELYNSSTGTIEINAGTYGMAVNSNASGSIVINGGSIKAVQGATPKNSAGTPLSSYGITLTNGSTPIAANTPVAAGELILTPTSNYGFNGVKTDASGTVYLWLPSTTATANYKSGIIDVSGGIVAGKTSVLPNYTARVTVKLNGETWDTPYMVLLLTSKDSFNDPNTVIPDTNKAKAGGVYEFSGLKPGQDYYIWGNGTMGGLLYSGVQVTSDAPNATVNFYNLNVTAGGGIDGVFMNATLIQGTNAFIQANVKPGYTFDKWANTTGGGVVLTNPGGRILMDGKKDLTATATLNTYNGSVTLNKDGLVWPSSGKTVTLSTSNTNVAGEGYKTVSDNTDGVYSFTALSPLVTYYVWMDGNYTGQTVTTTDKDVELDYYTVALTSGADITSVSGGGVYLKGTEIQVSATVQTGDYVFGRWQYTTGGAMVSTANPYTLTVSSPVSLTAVGGATKYSATVRLKKDGNDWTTSPRSIVLSTSESSLEGTVTGTVSGNTYTFANLPGTGNYYVWDAETVTFTGKQINSTGASAELEYFTVTVTTDSNIASVMGAGTYLKGSDVTVTVTPVDYYLITGAGWVNGKYTISNISGAQIISPAAALDTYTGTVNVKKDNAAWTDTTAIVTLSTSGTDKEAGKLTTSGTSGVFNFASLDPTKTYYVWADGVYTGQTVTATVKTAIVDYFTISVTKTNVDVSGEGTFLKGSNVGMTASNIADGYDFIGWKSGSTLLSTGMTFNVSNISSPQTLTAEASNMFEATVTLAGATGRDIKLSTSDTSLAGTVFGSGSGPCTFSGLTRGSTYYVYDGGTYTGKTVNKNAPNVTLQYYTVSLTKGTGIEAVFGGGTYLAGSTVSASASTTTSYVFSGWSDGSAQNPYTITNLNSDKTLTANGALSFTGTVDITNGPILIENDDVNHGKIRIKQNGIILDGGDNLDPKTNIIITGTSSEVNGIFVTAGIGAYVTLKDVSISGTTALKGCVDIADTAGNVTINLEGNNTLIGGSARAGIYKGMGSNTLTITGSGYLNATGGVDGFGQGAAGIGGAFISGARNGGNIIITSGNVNATGDGDGAGIGGAQFGSSGNITISGGTIFANGDRGGAGIGGGTSGSSGSISITGGVITATSYQDPWGNSGAGIGGGYRSNSGSVTITGGTIIATSGGPGAGIGGGSGNYDSGVTPGSGGNVTIRGGTITATSNGGSGIGGGSKNSNGDGLVTTNTTITITGGNIKTSSMGNTPVGSNGKALTLEANAWIDTPTIVDNRGIAYGMNDVQAIEFQMYAYVDRNGYYTLTTPASATQNGVTATANIPSNSGLSSNNTITVTTSLSGTALKPGTYTVGLIGTGIGTVATQTLAVTMGQSVSTSKTFSFTMPASNVTDLALLFSFSESAKHTVSYYNDSMLLGSAAYYAGETYTLMDGSGLNKIGYTFGGWGVSGNQTMGTSDVTHTAVWTANIYKVAFYNGNSKTTEQSFTYNVDTALNGSITKTGYTLSGWAETLNGPKVYNVSEIVKNLTAVQNGTVNLYKVWQAQDCSVTFTNGGGAGEMTPQSFIHGVAQELTPNTFARAGYTFTGWTDGTTTYVNGQSITATGDLSLTAQWAANSYRIVFNGNGANGGTTMANQSFSYDASQNLTNNTYTRDGYTFGGWDMSSGAETATFTNGQSVTNLTTLAIGTITLYAVWTPNSYTVNFNAGTGSGTMGSQKHTYDMAQTLTENAFTRTGYSFSGWNTVADGSGLNYEDKASVINLAMTGSVTLYAQWTADTYSLAFNSSNGVGSMDNQSFATGDSGKVSDNRFVKPGYTFDGWNTKADGNGTNYPADAELMSLDNLAAIDPTLYAKWRANSYTVAFNATGGSGSIADQSFTYGVPQNLTANSLTRGSDTFLGWSTSSTAERATYTDGQFVSNLTTMANGKVTLYAVWRANTYEVRFDANGGSGDMLPQTISRSEATSLNTNSYTRIGYSFAGWNTSINGSGPSYADAHQVTNLPGDTANSITLYAQWTESIRFNLKGTVKEIEGGEELSGATVKLVQGSTIVAQTMTGADGSYFFGNLKSGSYNVVAAKEGKTVTALVVISANTIQDMVIPAAAANNSILVVNRESNAEIPAVVVGGLDELASSESADITMTITSKVENASDLEQNAIKENAGSQIVGIYLDMTVKKGNDALTSTAKVLEIIIPFNLSGKTDINVYRYHEGTTMPLVKLTDKPVATFNDGTFYLDSANGLIHVYASQFSTYAVTYTATSSGGGGGRPASPVNIDNGNNAFPFMDVSEAHWAREAIGWANENGIFSGTSPTTFSPGISTSRGMVVAVLWRMEKNPLVIQDIRFTDVSTEAYYGKAVSWANENQVVLGYGNGLFGPNKTISREQMAAILYRYATMKGNDVSKQTPLDNFVDGGKTAGYAQNAMEWAVANNLISGKKNNVLDPKGNATRAEVAVILMRFSELYPLNQ